MDTNDLIRALHADAGSRRVSLSRAWGLAAAIAALCAAAAFFILIGPRPDIAEAAGTVRFLFKFVVTAALAAGALVLVMRMSRPGAPLKGALALIALAPALLAGAVGLEFFAIPPDQWSQRWIGSNSLVCLTFIPLMGIAPLAVFVAALRHGAPTRPGAAGAVAGLLAGGIAATFYAAHCTDDSPFFVATWYPIAIAMLTACGFVLGRRFCRW
jgi:hypothetical protein